MRASLSVRAARSAAGEALAFRWIVRPLGAVATGSEAGVHDLLRLVVSEVRRPTTTLLGWARLLASGEIADDGERRSAAAAIADCASQQDAGLAELCELLGPRDAVEVRSVAGEDASPAAATATDAVPIAAARHSALARSMVGHFVNGAMALVAAGIDGAEVVLDEARSSQASPQAALQALTDTRIGLARLVAVTGALIAGLPPDAPRDAIDGSGRVLVVTSDGAVSAAICAALHGDHVTACDTVPHALHVIEHAPPFEVIFCDASMATIWLLARVAWQEPAPRVVFVASATSDPAVVGFLSPHASVLEAPLDVRRIREVAV